MTKYIHYILIVVVLIFCVFIYYFWFKSQVSLPEQIITLSPILVPSTSSILTISLSEQELTKLWLNGERCPTIKVGFSIPLKEEDIIQEGSSRIFVNIVNVNFIDNATCEDAERIAQLINAKIVGFGPTTNHYTFQIPTRTKEELDAAIAKIDALNDPKIEGVFFDIQLRVIPRPF